MGDQAERPARVLAQAAADAGRAAATLAAQSAQLARRQIDDAGGFSGWLLSRSGPLQTSASWARKRIQIARNPRARILFEEPVYAGPGFAIDAPRGGSFTARAGSEFRRGFRLELDGADAEVLVGEHTVFTADAVVQCGAAVSIGAYCQIDYGVLIADGSYRFRRAGEEPPTGAAGAEHRAPGAAGAEHRAPGAAGAEHRAPGAAAGGQRRPLAVGDHTTVTTKCTVIADVGARTIVGANSVVTEALPDYVLAAGAPAKVIGYFGPEPPPQ